MSALDCLAPTINYGPEQISKIPLIENNKNFVDDIVVQNISVSKFDWDSFETSWEFTSSPLLNIKQDTVSDVYIHWKEICEKRFLQIKNNEEELNRIFTRTYGLEEELTPDVSDIDVTVYRVFDTKEDIIESMNGSKYILTKQDVIKNFFSYFIQYYRLDGRGIK